MSDDLSMGALSGSLAERTRAVLAAGCDIALHCNGDFGQMTEVAATAPVLAGQAAMRAQAALRRRGQPQAIDIASARAEFARMTEHTAIGMLAS